MDKYVFIGEGKGAAAQKCIVAVTLTVKFA